MFYILYGCNRDVKVSSISVSRVCQCCRKHVMVSNDRLFQEESATTLAVRYKRVEGGGSYIYDCTTLSNFLVKVCDTADAPASFRSEVQKRFGFRRVKK